MDIANLSRPEWAFDPAMACENCSEFLRSTLADASMNKLMLGLSCGIDSAVAAGVAVEHGADLVVTAPGALVVAFHVGQMLFRAPALKPQQ